jgi:hypothetical protein
VARLDSAAPAQLAGYAEMHHLLTARYLHCNGYSTRGRRSVPGPIPSGPELIAEGALAVVSRLA